MLEFSLEPEGSREVGLFFAHQKDGRLCLVIDARLSNLAFARPPGVEPCTGVALARIGPGADE
eukprot:9530093-Lingulodinium_polyedra.AAC.1